MSRQRRWARRVRNTSLVLFVVVLVAGFFAPTTGGAVTPGEAGTDTSLPETDSKVTVSGRGEYADLRVTVNQTKDLSNQAISVTWSGAEPTKAGVARFAEDFVQIMQCWGEPDGTVPDNPGPPPEQCVYGATDAVFGGRNGGVFPPGSFTLERVISREDFETFDPADGFVEFGALIKPFRSVDGSVVERLYNPEFNPSVSGGDYWLNPFFNAVTTNEIPGGVTNSDGTGEELFEITTGQESTGLGCGQKVERVAGGEPRVPRCWLVVVPRGSAAEENEGTPYSATDGVMTSPLAPAAWAHRIAIPLEFNPIDTACDIDDEPRRMAGSELPQLAITSWQPPLCQTEGLPPYSYVTIGDSSARSQIVRPVDGSPGMIAVSEPIDPEVLDPNSPVVYTPLTISGAAIGFNLERIPAVNGPEAEAALAGRRIQNLNLTPRLVAKLLTQSYAAQTAIKEPTKYEWAAENPNDLGRDPDFLRFNPEFELLVNRAPKNLGGLIMPSRSSDLAEQVWEWILSDPEAKAWLDGEPDEWGMVVNPVYATTAENNANGIAFGDPIPDTFPKSDPHCYQSPPVGSRNDVIPAPLCGTDWLPYSQSLRDAARSARIGDDTARTIKNPNAETPAAAWRRDGPQVTGSKTMLALVDTPSAARFGLQVARLSRSGDDGDERDFVAPTSSSLAKGVEAMAPRSVQTVLQPDHDAEVDGAYPMTVLTYAAIQPLALDAPARAEYAAFLSYAVGDGQVAGNKLGQLPPGYAPLPPALKTQAAAAVKSVTDLKAATAESPGGSTDGGTTDGGGSATGGSSTTDGSTNLGRTAAIVNSPAFDPSVLPELPGESEPRESQAAGTGPLTPVLALANNRFVLPILALVALGSALGAVELTRRPGPQPVRAPDGGAAS